MTPSPKLTCIRAGRGHKWGCARSISMGLVCGWFALGSSALGAKQPLASSTAASASSRGATAPSPAPAPRQVATKSTAVAADPFGKRSWLAPPPPPPPPVVPPPPPTPAPTPPPSAPTLPFSLLGLVENEPGVTTALLMQGNDLIVAKAGDEIAGKRYRVVSVSATAIQFIYLPLQQAQVLQVPGGAP